MNKLTAFLGYLFGIAAGAAILVSSGSMGMFRFSSDSFLYSLRLSPLVIFIQPGGYSQGFEICLDLQVFAFWGILGLVASQGHLRKARRCFAGMLVLHYSVACGTAYPDFPDGISIGMLLNYAPYLAIMLCFFAVLIMTSRRGGAKGGLSPRKRYFRTLAENRLFILACMAASLLLSVASEHAYVIRNPLGVFTLDLPSGRLTPVRSAGYDRVCDIDEGHGVFSTMPWVAAEQQMRIISFDRTLDRTVSLAGVDKSTRKLSDLDGPVYSLEAGLLANGNSSGGIETYGPEGTSLLAKVPPGSAIKVFWISTDSLLAITSAGNPRPVDKSCLAEYYDDTTICRIAIKSKQRQVLLDGIVFGDKANALAPDKLQFAFTHYVDRKVLLEVLNLVTGKRRIIASTDSEFDVCDVAWSTNSQRLAWRYRDFGDRAAISTNWMDLLSGARHTLSTKTPIDDWGKQLTFCGSDAVAVYDREKKKLIVEALTGGNLRTYNVPLYTRAIYGMGNGKKILLSRQHYR